MTPDNYKYKWINLLNLKKLTTNPLFIGIESTFIYKQSHNGGIKELHVAPEPYLQTPDVENE